MVSTKAVVDFVNSQKSLQFYKKMQQALTDVLLAMSTEDYRTVTKNLIIVCLHVGAEGQCMHFPPMKEKFKIVQLNYNKTMPISVMRHLVAHELGHVMQGRNWQKADNNKLELDADEWAKKWGFPLTENLRRWSTQFWKSHGINKQKY